MAEAQERAETLRGLSEAEVAIRRDRDGYNELPTVRRQSFAASALAVVREPMSLLLLVCGAIYMVLGDCQEALMLLGFVVFIMALTLTQERKTERALATLRDLASPRANVIREGRRMRIAGRELVEGDLVVLAEGDRVPADGVMIEGTHLAADESLLTGESLAVGKVPGDEQRPFARPGGEDLPFLYAGTLVTAGAGVARVHATGPRTEIGRIGHGLERRETQETQLQRETRRLVAKLAWVSAGLSLLAGAGYGAASHDALGGILAGLTLAMAILPNEFPVVVTMFLALGAWRLSRRRVLVRRIPAVESLGAVTVLCVDKTGTLTENRMTVTRIHAGDAFFDLARLTSEPLPESMHETVEYSILASRRDPFDPMERAFKELGERELAGTEHLHSGWPTIREYPMTREAARRRSPPAHRRRRSARRGGQGGSGGDSAAPGRSTAAERARMDDGLRALTADGLRVLAIARANVERAELPDDPADLQLRFVGLVGLTDPVRRNVPAAVRECREAGIRAAISPVTTRRRRKASHVKAGLDAGQVVTGRDSSTMDDAQLRQLRSRDQRVRPHAPGAEAPARRSPFGQRGDCGHDRRRCERRAGSQGSTRRRRDGSAGDRRRARGGGGGAPRGTTSRRSSTVCAWAGESWTI